MNIDTSREIWEGWTVQDFIDHLEDIAEYVNNDFKTRDDVKKWCMNEQPYYKKYIEEVVDYFCNKFDIK